MSVPASPTRRDLLSGLAAAAVLGAGAALAQTTATTQAGRIRVVPLARDLRNPWGLAFLPDGAMLVTERSGSLRRLAPNGALSAPLSGVPAVAAQGQGGLLDVALDPAFADNRLVYLSYAEPGPGGAGTAVARGRLEGDGLADTAVIFRQTPKVQGGQHFGCRLVFAPDGTLFVTLGERGRMDMAQDPSVHQGKLIRIRPDGGVPPDNPFVGRDGYRPEIWSLGHRNIQGAALHPVTKRLWINEHGPRGGDEINIPEPGLNYGWPIITHGIGYDGAPVGVGPRKEGLEQPIHQWTPSIGPSGMAFCTSDRYPGWQGNLFVGSLVFRRLVRLELDGTRVTAEERFLREVDERIRDVRQGPDGLLYLLTDESRGKVLRLEPA